MPAGSVYDPPERSGLGEFHVRNGPPRGGRARQPAVHPRPGQPGRGTQRIGRQPRTPVISGATLAENLPAALAIYADVLRTAAIARRAIGSRSLGHAAGVAGGRRRASAKGDARAAPPALSAAVGPACPRRTASAGIDHASTTSAANIAAIIDPRARSWAWPAASSGKP